MNERPSRLSRELYVHVTKAAATTALLLSMASPAEASALSANTESRGGVVADLTPFASGGLEDTANVLEGSKIDGLSGDMRTGSYQPNQYSQISITSAKPVDGQWIGPAVRIKNGGKDSIVGVYGNNGRLFEQIFEHESGNWIPLSGEYYSGRLAAGTTLELEAVGTKTSTTLALLEDGKEVLTAYENSIPDGVPGIEAYGTSTPNVNRWSSGPDGFQVNYLNTKDSVKTYDVISANNGYGPQELRILTPTDPAAGVAHNFLYVLPVAAGADNTEYGDGLDTLNKLDAQDKYNLTIVEPSFGIDPWYANNPDDPNEQEETYLVNQIVPWVTDHFATTHEEQNQLIGFSKSGFGGLDLELKDPKIFELGAYWDFPADMSNLNQYDGASKSYGTQANFAQNYEFTPAFLEAHKAPFENSNRIWIGGYAVFGTDMTNLNNLLTTEGIQHTTETPTRRTHSWTSGWVQQALSALYEDGQG